MFRRAIAEMLRRDTDIDVVETALSDAPSQAARGHPQVVVLDVHNGIRAAVSIAGQIRK